jgi:hypothetical protein
VLPKVDAEVAVPLVRLPVVIAVDAVVAVFVDEIGALRDLQFIHPPSAEGGFVSYGVKVLRNYRQAADHVDRILRDTSLPVPFPKNPYPPHSDGAVRKELV